MQSLEAAFDNELGAPQLVVSSIDFLREYGMEREGLFRVATDQLTYNKAQNRMRKDSFNRQQHKDIKPTLVIGEFKPVFDDDSMPIDDDTVVEEMVLGDVDDIAAVLKMFLLDLEEPLITFAAFETIREATISLEKHMINPSRWRVIVNRSLLNMPQAHSSTLFFILDFLDDVAAQSDINKMTISNLAVVFGPCFMRSPTEDSITDPMTMMNEARIAQHATQLIIEEFAHTTDQMMTQQEVIAVEGEEDNDAAAAAAADPVTIEPSATDSELDRWEREQRVLSQSPKGSPKNSPLGSLKSSPLSSPMGSSRMVSRPLAPTTANESDLPNTAAVLSTPQSFLAAPRLPAPFPQLSDTNVPVYDRDSIMPIISQDTYEMEDMPGGSKKSLVLMRIKKFNKAEQYLSTPAEGYMSPNNRLLRDTAASRNSYEAAMEKGLNRAQEKEEILRLAELSKRGTQKAAN